MPAIALFQPDIPQNVGAMMRLCACLDMRLHVIEPCGFPWNPRRIQQAGMDYVGEADVVRHDDWDAFLAYTGDARVILMTTKAAKAYTDFEFREDDILLAGSESSGAPDFVHDVSDGRILIPMKEGLRSLNIVNATAMIAGEFLRQVKWS